MKQLIKLSIALLACFAIVSAVHSQEKLNGFYSPHGGVFTPKGDMRVLIIYAGFGNTNGVGNQKLPHWEDNAALNSVPEYVEASGAAPEMIYSQNSDFKKLESRNLLNLSRLYYEMSLGKFRLVGDVFKDPRTGQPIRINIDPTETSEDFPRAAKGWANCNARVLHKMRELYPDFDWSPYDNRKNNPQYKFDNSETGPDGKPDYIIIVYRHSATWKIQPINGMNRWFGSGGGYSVLDGISKDFEYNGYHFDRSGFTQPEGKGTAQQILKFIEHEIAHELYACPHVMGANGAAGDHFLFCASGWGMMSGWDKINKTANGWERWALGWIDLKTGPENLPSDVRSIEHLVNGGVYTLRDFVTSGDVVRIKIPNTDEQYLWIENHQKKSIFDECPWANTKVSKDGEVVPPMDKGLWMYVENVMGKRTDIRPGMPAHTKRVNGIRVLNAQGNYDYTHEDAAKPPSWDYFWYNTLFTFRRRKSNPISGLSPFQSFPDDYPKKASVRGPGDEKIRHSNYFNGGGNEVFKIIRETNGHDTNLVLGHLGGVNHQARELFQRRSPAFQVGDELGLSGIQPILNHPLYRKSQSKLEPYVLNGLRVTVLEQNSQGDITIKIEFDHFELSKSARWCGDVRLLAHPFHQPSKLKRIKTSKPQRMQTPQSMRMERDAQREAPIGNNSTDSEKPSRLTLQAPPPGAGELYATPTYYSLNISSGTSLLLDKSGIANRHSITENKDFINLSVFTCEEGAYIHMESGSDLTITAGSSLILKAGSRLELEEGATVLVEKGGRLVIENGAELLVKAGARVDVARKGTLIYNNRQPARGIKLEGQTAKEPFGLRLSGTLEVGLHAPFKFNGVGQMQVHQRYELVLKNGAEVQVIKSGKRDSIWSNVPPK